MRFRDSAVELLNAAWIIIKRSALDTRQESRHRVVLELAQPIRMRTWQQILVMFQLSGFDIFLRARLSRWLFSISKLLKWYPGVALSWSRIMPSATLTCSDVCRQGSGAKDKPAKIVCISYDYAPGLKLMPGHFCMPYTMHPQIYVQYQEQERLEAYRQQGRQVRVLFAGNYDQPGYNNPIIHDLFGMLTRGRVIDFLRSQKLVQMIQTREELIDFETAEYQRAFVLIDSRLRISQDRWLTLMSRADFFLCLPGVTVPV